MRDQTKPSALATAFFTSGFWAPMETNWSRVGSAQQYQGFAEKWNASLGFVRVD